MSKREPKHMGEVMSDIAERYDKLTKTKKMKEFNLDNIKNVTIKDGTVRILYLEGTTHFIKENVKLIKNLTNKNDAPIVDHCI